MGTDGNFKGKYALITGGARNIGLEIAKALASGGASVAIADICDDLKTIPYTLSSSEDLDQAIKEITVFDSKALGLTCDVRSENQVEALIEKVVETFGRLDILVNNAGVNSLFPIEKLSEAAWNEVLDVCLKGTYLCCKHVTSLGKTSQHHCIHLIKAAQFKAKLAVNRLNVALADLFQQIMHTLQCSNP